MRFKGLSFLLTGLILVSIISSYILSIICVASELENEVEDIQDQIEDHIEIIDDQVEDQQEEEDILQDSYVRLDSFEDQEEDQEEDQMEDQEEDQGVFYRKSLSATRSLVNTYDSSVPYLFNRLYYYTSVRLTYYGIDGTRYTNSIVIFQKDKKPYLNLINEFVNSSSVLKLLDSPDIPYYIVYNSENSVINTSSVISVVETYLNDYGYPDSNCYWEAPEPTGEPTPTITPTVTPTPTEVPEQMPDDNRDSFRIMVIFCFGLCAGVVVGHFLSGFIK